MVTYPRFLVRTLRRLMLLMLVFCLPFGAALWSDDAAAGRLGGGKNLGVQRQITPHTAPQVAPNARPTAPAAPPPQTAPQKRPSWLGPLAGIATGLGLAWLFSSLGLSEAFGSLLLLALVAAGLFWLFRRLQSPQMRPENATAGAGTQATWRTVADETSPNAAGTTALGQTSAATANPLRAQLDEAAFLNEAKRQFVALQAAHDAQDWSAIARVVTPQLLAELQANPAWEAGQQTDLVQLSAELLDLTDEGDHYLATVRFSGLIRETPSTPPAAFAELWHLVKPKSGGGWKVAGIQSS
ncbi:Tim44 domain-containing protein [Hydrogenophilus thiooxidans]|uniref:Tim44 domain-containing protein n=1 Tax=Hydrogenophilus thiooxidans TaxID=2820326 RepID=UPI001C24E0F7|nr:Tim44-like domain-containing protein [Hydrogenophilus thiooxidans]